MDTAACSSWGRSCGLLICCWKLDVSLIWPLLTVIPSVMSWITLQLTAGQFRVVSCKGPFSLLTVCIDHLRVLFHHVCPFCHSSVETEIHRWWSCQHWNGLRALHLGRNAEIICEQLSSVSNVASICGIPTHGLSRLVRSQWTNVCARMIDIQAAANNHER